MAGPGVLNIDIREEMSTAVMAISHFAYYNSHDKFFGFINDAFEKINQSGIKNLIIDLRRNDGGGASTTGHLCSLLKYNKIGTFIGEETGGTYACNDAHWSFHLCSQ